MKKKWTSYLGITLLASLPFASCTKQGAEVSEKRFKEMPTIDIGPRIPEFRDTRNDTLGVALYPSAMRYFIDIGLAQSEDNIKQIKQANKLNIPVRVKVYEDNQREIAEIYPATEEDIAKHKESLSEWDR